MSVKYKSGFVPVYFKDAGIYVSLPIDLEFNLTHSHSSNPKTAFNLENLVGICMKNGRAVHTSNKVDSYYKNNLITVNNSPYGQNFSSENTLLTSFSSIFNLVKEKNKIKPPTFSVKKLYRFTYNGGTKPGTSRAVKVLEVHPTYIKGEELSSGLPKNYSLDCISNSVEITV